MTIGAVFGATKFLMSVHWRFSMKLGFLSKLFEGTLTIERTYNDCDRAIGKLRSYNEKLAKKERVPDKEKMELDALVNRAIEGATKLVNLEPERNWPGVFREMHKNLATIYLELDERDKVRDACEKLRGYGETGRLDAAEVLQKLSDKEGGKVDATGKAVAG